MLVVIHSVETYSSARSCTYSTDGEIACIRVIGYNHLQYARCSSDMYIQHISNGSDRCGTFNISRHCWLSCEKIKYFNGSDFENRTSCSCSDDKKYTRPTISTNNIAVTMFPEPVVTSYNITSNCFYLNDGEKKCMFSPDYTLKQWFRCASQSYVRQQSRGRYTCKNNSMYCWYSCQKETFNMEEGDVYKQCSCDQDIQQNSGTNSARKTSSSVTQLGILNIIITLLMMVLCS